jgi:transposase
MENVTGVDIGKTRLDAHCLASGRRLAVGNDAEGVARLAGWLEPRSLVVMGASGGYERLVHRLLTERGIPAAVVNPARVRHFAKAAGAGLLAKTDRPDAAVIARHGAFPRPAPTPLRCGTARARRWPSSWPTAAKSWPRSRRGAGSSAICARRP